MCQVENRSLVPIAVVDTVQTLIQHLGIKLFQEVTIVTWEQQYKRCILTWRCVVMSSCHPTVLQEIFITATVILDCLTSYQISKEVGLWLKATSVQEKLKNILDHHQQPHKSFHEESEQYTQGNPTQDHEEVSRRANNCE